MNSKKEFQYALNIILHNNQKVIHSSESKNKVVKAGKRFGKTKLALYRCVKKSLEVYNSVVWYIAPTYKQAKNIAWWELKWMIPEGLIKRNPEQELFIEFINGSRLQLIGADNEDSLRGPKLHHVCLDECAFIKEHVWYSIISGQLLGNDFTGSADFISSPNPKGRNWYTNFCEEAKRKETLGDKDWSYFYYTIYDNPTIHLEEIEKLKNNTPDETWNTEYMALESDLAGVIYHEFKPEHIGEYGLKGKLVRALDWGLDHPTVCLWIYVDAPNKKVYIENEFVKSGSLINESCDVVNRMTGNRAVEWSVIDPSTNKHNSQTGRTDREEFGRWGLYCIAGDNRDRGYDVTKMFFKKGMMVINPRCKNLIYALRNVQWGDKEGDDCTDALRYGMVRIHDMFFGGNLFDNEVKEKRERKQNEIFFDELEFKDMKEEEKQLSWMEAGTV